MKIAVFLIALGISSAYATPYFTKGSNGWTANEGIESFYVTSSGFEGELDLNYAFGESYQGCNEGGFSSPNGFRINFSCRGSHFTMSVQKCTANEWGSIASCNDVDLNSAPQGTSFAIHLVRRPYKSFENTEKIPTCGPGESYSAYGNEPMHCQKSHKVQPKHEPGDCARCP